MDPFAKDKVMKIESGAAIKRTAESIRYGDDLIYALEMAEDWRKEVDQFALQVEMFENKALPQMPERPKPSIHFLGRTVFDHVLLKLRSIRASDLEGALKFLSYTHACALLFYTEHYLRNVSETVYCKINFEFRTSKSNYPAELPYTCLRVTKLNYNNNQRCIRSYYR